MNKQYLRSNHAWNAVRINGSWRLVDATWAAGGTTNEEDEGKISFRKQFSEAYYFTDPVKFILNHFPLHKQFQLHNGFIDQKKFMHSPLYTTSYLVDSMVLVAPDTALIKAKLGDTIVFKFSKTNGWNQFYAYTKLSEKACYEAGVVYNDKWIEFHYPVTVTGIYDLFIGYLIGTRRDDPLLVYRLQVK